MNEQVTLRAVAIGCLVIFLVGIGLGAWGMHTWQVSDLRAQLAAMTAQLQAEKAKPPQIKETVRTETKTQLQYVPGETVYLPAPTPDNPDAMAPAKLDGKFDIGKQDFVYTINGKLGQFTKADDERYVFDKNMLKLTQTSQVNLAVEVPVIDKTKRNAIGPYLTTESWGAIVSREADSHRILLLGGKKWDNENGRGYEAGGAWQVKF